MPSPCGNGDDIAFRAEPHISCRTKRAQRARRLPPRETAPLSLNRVSRKAAFHAALSQNQLTHAGASSLTAGSLHDLTDDSAGYLNLRHGSCLHVGHYCQCFLNGCGERAVVGDHGEGRVPQRFRRGAFTGGTNSSTLADNLVVDLCLPEIGALRGRPRLPGSTPGR